MTKSLIGFQYLSRRRFLILVLALTMASTLFSVTAFSFLGFYNAFNSYLGEEEDVVAIYNRRSSTPFTSLIPVSLAFQITSLEGVLAVSPEVIVPIMVEDTSAFLRGIMPENFTRLTLLAMLQGDRLELTDLKSAIVGTRLAERLGVNVGDQVLVFSVLKEHYLELEVEGVFKSETPMDDEILAPIYAGQWLRGVDYGYATIIRVRIDRSRLNAESLWKALAEEAASEPEEEKLSERSWREKIVPIPIIRIDPDDIDIKEAKEFMASYLNKYGVSLNMLLILSLIVFVLASASSFSASKTFMQQHELEMKVLRSIGMSNRSLKIDLAVKVLPYSLASSIFGTVIAIIMLVPINKIGSLRALCHTMNLQFNSTIITLNIVLTLLITTISIAYLEMKA